MRVIHLGSVTLPPNHPDYGKIHTHPGRWVLNHAIAQKRIGLDVEIVCMSGKASCNFTTDVEGVRVHFLRCLHPRRAMVGYIVDRFRLMRYVRKLNPDIVHAHGTEDVYALAAQWIGKPYVITAQGLYFQILPQLKNPHPAQFHIRKWEDVALRKAKVVIAKSEYVRDGLHAEYPHLDLRLIPNTYQLELDAPLTEKTPNTLCFVGSIEERKGLHLIADAMPTVKAAIPSVEFHIIGNSSVLTGYAEEQVAKLRNVLGDELKLRGRMPSLQLFDALASMRALVAPSLEEMFGNQLIEGVMRGCHGIVADKTALAENVRRFGNGTVVPQRDVAALANSIIHTLQHPPSREAQEEARQNIRDYMGPESVARKHLALYQELVTGA